MLPMIESNDATADVVTNDLLRLSLDENVMQPFQTLMGSLLLHFSPVEVVGCRKESRSWRMEDIDWT